MKDIAEVRFSLEGLGSVPGQAQVVPIAPAPEDSSSYRSARNGPIPLLHRNTPEEFSTVKIRFAHKILCSFSPGLVACTTL